MANRIDDIRREVLMSQRTDLEYWLGVQKTVEEVLETATEEELNDWDKDWGLGEMIGNMIMHIKWDIEHGLIDE